MPITLNMLHAIITRLKDSLKLKHLQEEIKSEFFSLLHYKKL